MDISVDDVKYIARLAKLSFSDEQTAQLVKDFEGILTHFEAINKLDLNDVSPDSYVEEIATVLRKDETFAFTDKEKLFRNAKAMSDSYIEVPKIIE
ncbi:MAG: Asp-tRNA(Asn)/Glu-tRNA(Gln) amidotransferase subunit GatC [Pseudomonadota bacterium]